jgi:hypothetical protein
MFSSLIKPGAAKSPQLLLACVSIPQDPKNHDDNLLSFRCAGSSRRLFSEPKISTVGCMYSRINRMRLSPRAQIAEKKKNKGIE